MSKAISAFSGLAVTLVALAATGCAERVPPPGYARNDPYGREQIHVVDPDLRNNTAVAPPVLTRDDAGLLFVTIPIRATPEDRDIRQLHVDYRVTFFDANGQPLNQTGWKAKTLSAGVPDQITFNSTSPHAKDFQLDLRWAK